MLTITQIIAKANGTTEEGIEKLEASLKQAAVNGVSILHTLQGHCAGAASNPTFVDQVCSQMKNADGVAVTPQSPLMSVIHQEVPGTEAKPVPATPPTTPAKPVE